MVVNHNMAAIGQSRQLRYNVKKNGGFIQETLEWL